MPLLIIARVFFSCLSLAVLGAAAYLGWTWYEGNLVLRGDGVLIRVRDDWRLWVSIALFGWSALGRFITTPLLATRDKDPTRPQRSGGRVIEGADGAKLYVEIHGPESAPCIVLTHGWGLDSTVWYYARRDLAKQYRVVSWDLPGMGRSHPSNASHAISLSAFAKNLAVVMKLGGTQKVILVGHSIGGMTIQTLAREYPEVMTDGAAGIVLLNTTYTNPLKTMVFSGLVQALSPVIKVVMHATRLLQPFAWLSAWQSYFSGSAHIAERLGFGGDVTHSQLEHATLLGVRNPPGNQARGNLAMFEWDATEALAKTPIPILVIGGDKDIVTKVEASRRIASTLADATLKVVPGANHMGFMEQAQTYNAAISDFTRRTASVKKPAQASA